MRKTFKAMDPELVMLYIEGKDVFYRDISSNDFQMMHPYREPFDVYRLSNPNFEFSIIVSQYPVEEVNRNLTIDLELTFDSILADLATQTEDDYKKAIALAYFAYKLGGRHAIE